MNRIIVTIPAFEPDRGLVQLVARLKERFCDFIVVDDGSRTSSETFAELRDLEGVRVLAHDVNRGKGVALKTAFSAIRELHPDARGTVTVDADGQHLPEDVFAVADSLLKHPDRLSLGVRTFGVDTPFRSKFGNLWTIAEFRLLTGRLVRDTQSGLRGIPAGFLPRFLEIPGERYEYEIRMLVRAALAPCPIAQIPIRTVYRDGNRTSHFRPLVDTLRTQHALLAAALTERFGS